MNVYSIKEHKRGSSPTFSRSIIPWFGVLEAAFILPARDTGGNTGLSPDERSSVLVNTQ